MSRMTRGFKKCGVWHARVMRRATARRRTNRINCKACFQLGNGLEPLEQRVLLSTYAVTSLLDDGSAGTLRSAIILANNNPGTSSSPDVITFNPALFTDSGPLQTITLTQGLLTLSAGDTVIQGPGSNALAISGQGSSGVLQISLGVTAAISGLTITGGNASGDGGGINNAGDLTLSNVDLSADSASNGGAIDNSGALSLLNVSLLGNNATGANGDGGGIFNAGTLTINNSTLANDSATGHGGGVFNGNAAQLTLINSTLSGDSASGDAGGGIAGGGTVTIDDATLLGNSALSGGGMAVNGGASFTLDNSIIAGNSGGDVVGTLAPASGYNLIGDGSGGLTNGVNGNILGSTGAPINPLLSPLSYNGGPTQTMAPLSGSPAIDAGNNALIPSGILTDQRGLARLVNGTVDIGAVEYVPSPPPVVTTPGPNTPPYAFTLSGNYTITGSTVDPAGDYYVVGFFSGEVDFDPNPADLSTNTVATGNKDLFIAKYDPNGAFLWVKTGDTSAGSISMVQMALDGAGNIYLDGSYTGSVNLSPSSGMASLTSGSGGDLFIAKFDPSGNLLWQRTPGGAGYALWQGFNLVNEPLLAGVDSLAVNPADGDVYFAGSFTGDISFAPGLNAINLSTNGTTDGFVAKLDTNGNFTWAYDIGGNTGGVSGVSNTSPQIALDAAEDVYVAGTFFGTINFNPSGSFDLTSTLIGFGEPTYLTDGYVAKYNTNGGFLWVEDIGVNAVGPGNIYPTAIAVDAAGNVFLGGSFYINLQFNAGSGSTIIVPGEVEEAESYIAMVNPSGDTVWGQTIYDTNDLNAFGGEIDSIAVAPNDEVYVTGAFRSYYATAGAFTINQPTDSGASLRNFTGLFIATLDGSGNFDSFYDPVGGDNDNASYGTAIFPGADGALYLTGDITAATTLNLATGPAALNGGYFVSKDANAPDVPLAGVTGKGEAIPDGRTSPMAANGTDFGTATLDGETIDETYNITNTGTGPLTVGTFSLPAGFTLISAPAATVDVGDSTTFTLGLLTAYAGTFGGYVFISTNDPANNPYLFEIAGTVSRGAPAITWANPGSITYGTPLGGGQLDAAAIYNGASVPGTFTYSPAAGTLLHVGAGQTLGVTFTPSDATDFAGATGSALITVNQATPVITWGNPGAMTYGTALSATQLDATANVPGTFVYTPAAGTVLPAAANQTLNVTFTPSDGTDYNSASGSALITVNQATPVMTWANPAAITYGTALSAMQLDAMANTLGTFIYTPPAGTILQAGVNQTLSVVFSPTDATDFTTVDDSTQITVNKAAPVVTWANPANITFGTALSSTQLDATANEPGTFVYTPAVGTLLNAGVNQTLGVEFTPIDTTDYTTGSGLVQITVGQATPEITWANPASITYGTALSATQLDATASFNGSNVPGTFAYTPAAGTVLHAGANQTLSVVFTPTDPADYTTAGSSAQITVNQATPEITWANPASIAYGTPLSPTQLDAAANVLGTFVYTPAAGTVLQAGVDQTLSAVFTPTDTADYTTVVGAAQITVNQVTPVVTWTNPVNIVLGTTLSVAQLDATANVGGSFFYPLADVKLLVGSYTLSTVFTPSDSTNYSTADGSAPITVLPFAATNLVFTTQPKNTIAGATLAKVVVKIEGAHGKIETDDDAPVSLTIASGTPAPGSPGTFTGSSTTTVNAVDGVATFTNLVLDTAGTYKLAASDAVDTLSGFKSGSFKISPAAVASVAFVQQPPASVVAGKKISPAITVVVKDVYANVISGAKVTLAVVTKPTGGAVLGSLSATTSTAGVATFSNLSAHVAGQYSLVASVGKVSSAASDDFTVAPAAPVKLVFTTQPGNAIAGSPLAPVVVQIRDTYGNLETGDNSAVSMTIASGPKSDSFTGSSTTTVNAVDGVATFNNLALDTAGTYKIKAKESTEGLSVTSTAFKVT